MSVRRIAALAVAAVLALAGCQSTQGAAAIVYGETISQQDVDTVVDELLPVLPTTTPTDALHWLVAVRVLDPIAERYNMKISADEAKIWLQGSLLTPEQIDSLSPPTIEVIRAIMTNNDLGHIPQSPEIVEEVIAALTGPDVEVNPRYGQFNENAELRWVNPEWIVTP